MFTHQSLSVKQTPTILTAVFHEMQLDIYNQLDIIIAVFGPV
jgi:hypothetical protein